MQKTISVQFLSDWHISQGTGDGYKSDSIIVRDADGFPCIPGRALKGALREGAQRIGQCRKDLKEAENFFFGTRNFSLDTNNAGIVRVSTAHLPPVFAESIKGLEKREELLGDLVILRSQTAINDDGLAQSGSLRTIECALMGLELFAQIEVHTSEIEDSWVEQYFSAVCLAVKSIGGGRSRGLGRCRLTLLDTPAGKLPGTNDFLRGRGK